MLDNLALLHNGSVFALSSIENVEVFKGKGQ